MTNYSLKFKNLEEVQNYAQKQSKLLLLHNDLILDATTFQSHHPGGGLLLRNANLKAVDQDLAYHHPLTITMADTMAIGSFKKEVERMVDPSLPLGPQVWSMDHQTYIKLTNSPHWLFVESPRLFHSDFLQFLSHAKWYMVPIIPSIMIYSLLSRVPSWDSFNLLSFLLAAVTGLLIFSLVEYCLHRFIFHSEGYLPRSRLARYLHFFTHGVHHMLPNDPLVLPVPLFLIIYYLVVEGFVKQILVFEDPVIDATVWSFFLVGYVIYDVSHYAFHFVDTTKHKGSWFHRLQKYHNRHHFSGQYAGFGVSTPFWDIIFRSGFGVSTPFWDIIFRSGYKDAKTQ